MAKSTAQPCPLPEKPKRSMWLYMPAGFGLLCLLSCGSSTMSLCEDAMDAYCAWEEKCNQKNKATCAQQLKKLNCTEEKMKRAEEECDKHHGRLEHKKDSCVSESSINCKKQCNIGGIVCVYTTRSFQDSN